jgi:hypothetical protein
MRAAAWLVDTVATSNNRLRGIIRAVVLRARRTTTASPVKPRSNLMGGVPVGGIAAMRMLER